MKSGRELRRIVMYRIIDQVPEFGLRVYDKATEDVDFPYVTMGPSYWVDDSAQCIESREITLQVDVWHSASNKGALEDLTDDVATSLKGWSDEAELTMHPMQIDTVRVTDDPDGVSVHGMVMVRAMVEA